MDSVLARRSIRKYKKQKIEDDKIKKILEAGMSAPSSGNEQPWHFIVVDDKSLLEDLSKVSIYAGMLKNADIGIIICGDLGLERHKGFWVQDCSAATENVLIEIQELGLGGVWLGIYPLEDRVKAIQEIFKLPDNIIPFSIIPVGYPDEKKETPSRYNPNKVRYNRW